MHICFFAFLEVLALLGLVHPLTGQEGGHDPRNLLSGFTIPDEGYCDQPYIVITKDGNWLCTLTTGPGHEGQPGQHVVAAISKDEGRNWSALIDIEPSSGPEASWVVPLIVPGGRVYAFYSYNGDRVDTLDGKKIRADMMGWYVFKYSDDHGKTWSKKRYRLPMRVTACDRTNDWEGKVQIFWGIDKPSIVGNRVYFAFTKLGKYMLDKGEGWFFTSDNILFEKDPEKIRWELLPEGEHGVRNETFGSIQEEHNIVPLSDLKTLYCVYRTTNGYPCHAYSFDEGRSWTEPEFMTHRPGGRRIKNNRACPKLWRTMDGRFLFWFHNHSGKTYSERNPAWIVGGEEKDGRIHWSEPEILLFDPDPGVRMSYPCFFERDGRYHVTETNKAIARVHEIDKTLLEGLWNQGKVKTVAREGLMLELGPGAAHEDGASIPVPLNLQRLTGVSIDLWIRLADVTAGQVLVDSRDEEGRGLSLTVAGQGRVRIDLDDGKVKVSWESDGGLLKKDTLHHVAAIVDNRARVISFIMDGVFCDGGEKRQYGWGRYQGYLGDVSGSGKLDVAPKFRGELKCLRIYNRYLRTSEAIGNFHAGL